MGECQVDLSLCRLAAIALSKHLWKYSRLKNSLQSCIKNDQLPENVMPPAVKGVLDEFILPESAKEELMLALGTMGWEVQTWIEELKHVDKITAEDTCTSQPDLSSYVDYICWKDHGCIDYPETIRSLYISGTLPNNFLTWMMFCNYCLEDCIYDFLPKLSDAAKVSNISRWTTMTNYTNWDPLKYDLTLTAYWIARVANCVEFMTRTFRNFPEGYYDPAYSFDENMFMNSFACKKYSAVKFFWESLNDNQRRRTIRRICERILSDDPLAREFKTLFSPRRGLSGDLLTFFLHQLSFYGFNDVRKKILGSEFVLGQLVNWPHDSSFMKIFREPWIHHSSFDYNHIVGDILGNLERQYKFLDRDVKYRRIFFEIWGMNPLNLKSSLEYDTIFEILWPLGDIELLKYIVNDRTLHERRKELLKEIVAIHVDDIMFQDRTDSNFLEKFVREVLGSAEEREWFMAQIMVQKENMEEGTEDDSMSEDSDEENMDEDEEGEAVEM